MITTAYLKSALLAALLAASVAPAASLTVPASAASMPAASSSADADHGSAPEASSSDSDDYESDRWDSGGHHWHSWGVRHRFGRNTNDLVSVGHDTTLPAGSQADSVVAVFGSATNNGTARQDVASVFGDTTVNGATQGSAVAVLGNVSVNADVDHDVVVVLGDVHLGPAAHVHGHVVTIFGTVTQDPGASIDQGVERILTEDIASADGVRHWVGHGLMLGRPLVIGSGLQWLWGLSFAFLAIYTLLALLFRDAAEHCIATLNENPGKSLITAILAVLLTPLMLFLLAITVVGILDIPIALVTLFCAVVFGKTTVLGWIGNRCFGIRSNHAAAHPALAVIVGGLLVMLVYLVPIVGFVVFILLGMIGYGAVLYALINRIATAPLQPRTAHRACRTAADPNAATTAAVEPTAAAPHAAPQDAPDPGLASSPSAPLPLSTLPRATFWVRMGALLIDALIVWAVLRLLLQFPQEGSTRLCVLGLAVYGAVMWKAKGTTIGGIACDLRVVRLDSRPLDWPTACVRALGCILSLCALGLGFFWIGIDPGKQAWHDKLAGTVVVRVPKGTPLV